MNNSNLFGVEETNAMKLIDDAFSSQDCNSHTIEGGDVIKVARFLTKEYELEEALKKLEEMGSSFLSGRLYNYMKEMEEEI